VATRPPAIGRSAINEFRKARAQFRQDRAAADAAAEAAAAVPRATRPSPDPVAGAGAPGVEPLVLLAHGEPLSLALSRRRRDESATVDRRLRLTRMVAREDRLSATIAELSHDETIDLRDSELEPESETLAPVVDLRERAEARDASAKAAADVSDAERSPLG
jgi:hypothetical protein